MQYTLFWMFAKLKERTLKTQEERFDYVYSLTMSRSIGALIVSLMIVLSWFMHQSFVSMNCHRSPFSCLVWVAFIYHGWNEFKDYLDGKLARHWRLDPPGVSFGAKLDIIFDAGPRIMVLIALLVCEGIRLLCAPYANVDQRAYFIISAGVITTIIVRDFAALAMRYLVETMTSEQERSEVVTSSDLIGKIKTWSIGLGSWLMISFYALFMKGDPQAITFYWLAIGAFGAAILLSLWSLWRYTKAWYPVLHRVYQQQKSLACARE